MKTSIEADKLKSLVTPKMKYLKTEVKVKDFSKIVNSKKSKLIVANFSCLC